MASKKVKQVATYILTRNVDIYDKQREIEKGNCGDKVTIIKYQNTRMEKKMTFSDLPWKKIVGTEINTLDSYVTMF